MSLQTMLLQATIEQTAIEKWFCEQHGMERWTILYRNGNLAMTGLSLFACLLPIDRCKQSLQNPGWDLTIGSGGPGFSQRWYEGERHIAYHRVAGVGYIEPIVIVQSFHNNHPDYVTLTEDLRLLFNLYEDRERGEFYEMEKDGSETTVVKVHPEMVEIRTTLLMRYLAARQLALVLQIDSRVWSPLAKEKPVLKLPEARHTRDNMRCIQFDVGTEPLRGQPFSRLFGKKHILPPDRSVCAIWPFEVTDEYLDFIVGEDDQGREIEHSSNPGVLADRFGSNPVSPSNLTPVFFDRAVLHKYYEDTEHYEVHSGGVRRGSLWNFPVDVEHTDYVVAFLGDLGRLSISEQRHWRAHNLMPEERQLSNTAFRRTLLNQWADTKSAEHLFKRAYRSVNSVWASAFGWPLFKELHADDKHVLSSLRLPLSNTANEFDSQMIDLAKLVVDSLNEEQIGAELTASKQKGDKGIAKFERLLIQLGYPEVTRDMTLLRTVQGIRSKGAAHRKGSDYNLAQAGLDPKDYQKSFRQLLEGVTLMLREIENFATSR